MCVYARVCKCVCIYIYVIRIRMCVYACGVYCVLFLGIRMCVYECVCVSVCAYIYVHAYISTNTHAYPDAWHINQLTKHGCTHMHPTVALFISCNNLEAIELPDLFRRILGLHPQI